MRPGPPMTNYLEKHRAARLPSPPILWGRGEAVRGSEPCEGDMPSPGTLPPLTPTLSPRSTGGRGSRLFACLPTGITAVVVSLLFTAVLLVTPTNAGGKSSVILRVVTHDLPAPFHPLTDVDRQAQDLIFEPLIAALHDDNGTVRYRPGLAEAVPVGQGTHPEFRIRASAKWSSGEPVTANDVRRSLERRQQDAGAPFAWMALLDPPQLGNSTQEVRLPLRQGLIDPWECFTFPIEPQQFARGGEAGAVGSGPFVLVESLKVPAGIRFRKNSYHPSAAAIPFDEIHWFAAGQKELEALKPDLVLGNAAGVKGLEAKAVATRRVWYVAPNHRHPLLAQRDWRRFLGESLQREKIVGVERSVNGLTPRDSWARASRLAADLHRPVDARALASQLAQKQKSVALSFKFPADQEPLMTPIIAQWHAAAQAGGLDLKIQALPLAAADLAQALAKRDFELALAHEEHGDSIGRLTALFDQRPPALAPSGSNFLGVEDGKLQQQIASLPLTRQFPLLRERMHNLHAHMVQTMTLIPLWQDQTHYALNPAYRIAPFDPLRPFADISAWRK
jgi:hypothetical protein